MFKVKYSTEAAVLFEPKLQLSQVVQHVNDPFH